MARLKNRFFGKLISSVSQYDNKPYEDWRADYTGQEGLILLFQSMHSAPGKIFFYMMIREGKWMHSSLGEWKPGEATDILYTRHSIYTFSRQHHLSKDEKWALLENTVLAGIISRERMKQEMKRL